MIRFVGSEFLQQPRDVTGPELIMIEDHHYNEELGCYPIQQLLDDSPYQHTVVFDHVLRHEGPLSRYDLIFVPAFLARTCRDFVQQNIVPDWGQRPYTFNFMINKPRLHREFLLVLIDHFKLTNYTHTLCWKKAWINPDLVDARYRPLVRQPVSIEPRQFLLGQENLLDRGLQYRQVRNSQNYQSFLQHELFENSCVSIITEPAFYEQETIITEKTIMALWGGTIPIWMGGWRIADYLGDLGFDTFDDVVDHSYQALADPWDRAYYAIERNLALLQDHASLERFCSQNRERFEHNLDLVKSNIFQRQCTEMMAQRSELSGLFTDLSGPAC